LLEGDLAAISEYLETELQPSTNGVALFACSGRDLFEAVQLGVPFVEHWMSIDDRPHLYPLARVESEYPRYAAVLADTNVARILVIATGAVVDAREVTGVKTRRTDQGGWSQARFQRHIENFHLHHAKEVVEALARIVQQEGIEHVLLAGDEVILPLALSGEAAKADPQVVRVADELVTRARNTSARITFIEDTSVLAAYGGVAASLRFRGDSREK
jgi:peptide chain release factor subunit 1